MMNSGHPRCFLFLYCTFFSLPGFLISQDLYKSGYILTNNRDTQYALIDYETNGICKVKQKETITIYDPDQILGFGFPQDRYYNSQVIRDTFVEVLVTGPMSLYRFNKTYYIQKKQQSLIKIQKRPNRKQFRQNSMEITEDVQWKGVLRYLMSDCPGIPDDFDQLNFTENALRKKIIEYNLCTRSEYTVFKAKLPFITGRPGLGMAITQSSLGLSETDLGSFPTQFKTTHVLPFVQAEFFSPKVFSKFSLRAEAHYNKFKSLSETQLGAETDRSYFESYHDVNFLSIPAMLSYRFIQGKIRISLLAGLQKDLILSQKTRLITERFTGQTVYTELNRNAYSYGKQSTGFAGGISMVKPLGQLFLSCNFRYNSQLTQVSGTLERALYDTNTPMHRFSILFAISRR